MNDLIPQRTFTHVIGGITHHFAAYGRDDLPSAERFFGCAETEEDLARGNAGFGVTPAAAAAAYWNKI